MTLDEILQDLEIYRAAFIDHHDDWVRLKQQNEFVRGVDHHSPIRAMFAEGSGTAGYLVNHLDQSRVRSRSMTVSNYINTVNKCIPPIMEYLDIGRRAQHDFELRYSNNHTVQSMLRLYNDQLSDIQQVAQLIIGLSATRPPFLSPLAVIRQHAKDWENDVQLHQHKDEVGLRAQLVNALRKAGYTATAEAHTYQGHADIVVHRPMGRPNEIALVAECKIWDGDAKLQDGISQLCRYVTTHVDMAIIVLFVTSGSFSSICEKAADALRRHEACDNPQEGYEFIEFSLILPQDLRARVPAALLLCNLTTPRYSR